MDSKQPTESRCFQHSLGVGQTRGQKRQLERIKGRGERKNGREGWDSRDERYGDLLPKQGDG